MDFIDLFAGLGCFHQALARLGHKCVYASEIDPTLNELYETNWDLSPEFDIRDVDIDKIPQHHILCAGFPCQPFSLATPTDRRQGFNCKDNGDLFYKIVEILQTKKPNYFILENSSHLKTHNGGKTLKTIEIELETLGYKVERGVFSPSDYGIPHNRRRLFIVGNLSDVPSLPVLLPCVEADIGDFLDEKPSEARNLSEREIDCLNLWQDFVDQFPPPITLPSPLWSREFGATYAYKTTTPEATDKAKLRKRKGNHGIKLSEVLEDDVFQHLPNYVKRGQDRFPDWKVRYIENSRKFYRRFKKEHKAWFNEWQQKISVFPPIWQRFEWNCQTPTRNIWDQIIQFRRSGVRVTSAKRIPTLVTKVPQVPIIGWEKRYLTPRECARFQSIEDNMQLPDAPASAFKAIGNAVNVKVVYEIANALIG